MFLKVMLFLIAFLVGADELMLGPILTPIGHDLGVPPERVTLFITAYSVALALVAPLLGGWSDRFGRLAIMLPASIIFGAASIATGLVETFEWGIITRILTGLASAGMLPIAFAMAADRSSTDMMKCIASVQSGLTLGMISSPALGALFAEWLSWRAAFIALGLASWGVALGLLIIRVQDDEKPKAAHHDEVKPAKLWKISGALGGLSAMCLGLGGGIGLFNLIGQHLHDTQGMPIWSIGSLYAALGFVSVLGNVLLPRLAHRFESGRQIMRLALVVCLVSSVGFYLYPAQQLTLLMLPLFFWALAGGIGSPALQGYLSGLSSQHRGRLLSWAMTMMHIGVAVWSATAGLAYSVGSWAMALLAIFLFGSAIFTLRPVTSAR
ncbi:MFS transporter [Vibrio mimicus]|uniref:MFS transporter n=1 Tax=Vibrio mimicus TaxID=674 RepID=UPI0013024BB4|nr:MFS transporter [Vibrio mimicus]